MSRAARPPVGVRDSDPDPSEAVPLHVEPLLRVGLVSRLDTRAARLTLFGLAGLVAVVAVNQGVETAAAFLVALSVVVVVLLLAVERDRWTAQLVMARFRAQRRLEWLRDTGGLPPNGSRAEAEVWLGVHRPGTVAPRYRAIVADQTRDPVVIAREHAALPDATPLERASRDQLALGHRWLSEGVDTSVLRSEIAALPDTVEGRMLKTWVGQVEATQRLARGERRWVDPLLAVRDVVPRPPIPTRWWVAVWASRFLPVVSLVISSVVFSAIGLSIASRGEQLPARYADTELAARGDVPRFDADRVWHTLPALERALPAAESLEPRAMTGSEVDDLLSSGLPTVIWTVGRIEVGEPTALGGHRIWEVEVLLGPTYVHDDLAIITVDRSDGARYLYRVDGSVVAALRSAAGVGGAAPSG